MTQQNLGGGVDFSICPHCWHVNPPARLCARCFADMTTVLQETGGRRWTAAAQSPMPVRAGRRLTRRQRALLLSAVVLFALAQLMTFAAAPSATSPSSTRGEGKPRPTTDD